MNLDYYGCIFGISWVYPDLVIVIKLASRLIYNYLGPAG